MENIRSRNQQLLDTRSESSLLISDSDNLNLDGSIIMNNEIDLQKLNCKTKSKPFTGFNISEHGIRETSTPNIAFVGLPNIRDIEIGNFADLQVPPSSGFLGTSEFNDNVTDLQITPSSEISTNEKLIETEMVMVLPSSNITGSEKICNSYICSKNEIPVKENVDLKDLLQLMQIQLKQNLEIKNEIATQMTAQKEEIIKTLVNITNRLDARLGEVEATTISLGIGMKTVNNVLGDLQKHKESFSREIDNVTKIVTEAIVESDIRQEKVKEVGSQVAEMTTGLVHLKTQVDKNVEDLGIVQLEVKENIEQVALLMVREQVQNAKIDVNEQKMREIQISLEEKIQDLEKENKVSNQIRDDKVEKNHISINNLTKLISADKESIAEVLQNLISPVSNQLAPLTSQLAQIDKIQKENTRIMSSDITTLIENQGNMYKKIQEVEGVLKKQTLELNRDNRDRDTKQIKCEQSLKQCWTKVLELQQKFEHLDNKIMGDMDYNGTTEKENTIQVNELPQKDDNSAAFTTSTNTIGIVDSTYFANKDNSFLGEKMGLNVESGKNIPRKVVNEQSLQKQLPALYTSLILDRANQDRMPHYNGENMPAPQFLRNWEEYLHRSGVVDDVDKIEMFPMALFGKPQQWWGLSNTKYNSWKDLKENFLRLFFSDYDRNKYENEWIDLNANNFIDIENMVVKGIQLQLILNEKDPFAKICERVTQKLPPVLADFMLLQKFHSVEEYLIGLRETMRLKNYKNQVKSGNMQNKPKVYYNSQGFHNNNQGYGNSQGHKGYEGNNPPDNQGKDDKQQYNQQLQNNGNSMKSYNTGTPLFVSQGNNPPTSSDSNSRYNIPGVSKNYKGNNPIPYFKKTNRPTPYNNSSVSAITKTSYNQGQNQIPPSQGYNLTEGFVVEFLDLLKKVAGQTPINILPLSNQDSTSEVPTIDNIEDSEGLNMQRQV